MKRAVGLGLLLLALFAAMPVQAEELPVFKPVEGALAFLLPAAEDRGTIIVWNGSQCTAVQQCPAETVTWYCASEVGDCQTDGCSMTCNGFTRHCPTAPGGGGPACIPF